MLSGIAVFGWLTAAIASLFVERGKQTATKGDHLELRAEIAILTEKIDRLTAQVDRIERLVADRKDRAKEGD